MSLFRQKPWNFAGHSEKFLKKTVSEHQNFSKSAQIYIESSAVQKEKNSSQGKIKLRTYSLIKKE